MSDLGSLPTINSFSLIRLSSDKLTVYDSSPNLICCEIFNSYCISGEILCLFIKVPLILSKSSINILSSST